MDGVRLRWLDACDNHDDAVSYDDAHAIAPVEIWSLGFLVALTDEHVTIAQSAHITEGAVRDILTVPLGMVVELRPLELGKAGGVLVLDGNRTCK